MNILLTSVGRRKYLVEHFRHALKGKGELLATNLIFTSSLLSSDYFELTPPIHDNSYIPFLIDLCQRKKVDAIVSLFDIDLPVLAAKSKEFYNIGTRFIGPDLVTAKIANDKMATHAFLKEIGILSPDTYSNLDEAISAIEQRRLHFPLIIKPRFGMGSIGIFTAEDMSELVVLYKKCANEVLSTDLKYESSHEPQNSVLIQEQLVGQECGLDLYKDLNQNLVGIVAKKKIEMRSGETDIGEIISSTQFEKFSTTLGNNLIFSGLLSVDCFTTSSGIYCTEINPRISGHYPFSYLAGVRYPEQLICWLQGGDTKAEWLSAKIGVRGSKEINLQILSG
jgi:carbamoyl-phosphate synthase large subunit